MSSYVHHLHRLFHDNAMYFETRRKMLASIPSTKGKLPFRIRAWGEDVSQLGSMYVTSGDITWQIKGIRPKLQILETKCCWPPT